MSTSLKIAWRYLFAKKSHNAINIVSGVSAAGVMVVTAALVVVLSVMNGFGALVEQMFSEFDADLRITAANGKYFSTNTEQFAALSRLSEVEIYSEVVEEMALIRFADKQVPAKVVGVDDNFAQLTHIDSIITDGYFSVCDWYEDPATGMKNRAFERCVMGTGLASQIGIGAHFVGAVKLYAPKRTAKINMLRPDRSFNEANTFIAGIFAVNQIKYDDQYILVSLPLARFLFEYDSTCVTAVEIKLADGVRPKTAKKQICQLLGSDFEVKDRYEQQEDYFRIMKIEKLLTTLLLTFILLIATFNIIGSLTMLIIDKKEDINILYTLGANEQTIRRIFLYEGWLISLIGAAIGIVVGVSLCLLQQHFGFIKLGSGTEYIISAYPVQVHAADIVLVSLIVITLGFIAAFIPSKRIKSNINQ